MSQGSDAMPSLEFLIGRDGHGRWLVVEIHGLAGGFFSSAQAAYRYVRSDHRERARRIEVVDRVLDPFGRTCLQIAETAAAAPDRMIRRAAAA